MNPNSIRIPIVNINITLPFNLFYSFFKFVQSHDTKFLTQLIGGESTFLQYPLSNTNLLNSDLDGSGDVVSLFFSFSSF